jgi:acyl-CoA reductase-like NAD-dependent aldehyde dehydrogenase
VPAHRRRGGRRWLFPAADRLAVSDGKTRMLHEEAFGPVAPIVAVDSIDEAIRCANSSSHGLAGYLFTDSGASCRP